MKWISSNPGCHLKHKNKLYIIIEPYIPQYTKVEFCEDGVLIKHNDTDWFKVECFNDFIKARNKYIR